MFVFKVSMIFLVIFQHYFDVKIFNILFKVKNPNLI